MIGTNEMVVASMLGVFSVKYTSRAAGRGGVSVGRGVVELGTSVLSVGVTPEGVGLSVGMSPKMV